MPVEPIMQILAGFLIASVMMIGLWLIQRRTHNAGIVDAGWAAGTGILGMLYAATSDGYLSRRVAVATMTGTWAFRLAVYLVMDRVRSRPEDGRYARLRKEWGASAERRLFFFFQSQAFFVVFFSLPVLAVTRNPQAGWSAWDVAGVLIWCISVGNTILADRQLARFRARPENRGKTCQAGWWHYSRHPNYFFEWLHWWSYVLLAVGAPYAWATLLAPAAMLYLLFRVTGIPPTEAQALASRGEDYRAYQRATSVFFPWFPRKESGAR